MHTILDWRTFGGFVGESSGLKKSGDVDICGHLENYH
jgi:hypothetical protein